MKKIAEAIDKGDLEKVKTLLKDVRRGQINQTHQKRNLDKVTLLYQAVFLGHEDIVKLLVASGADVSVSSLVGQDFCPIWTPPLHIAVVGYIRAIQSRQISSQKRIVQFLVESGADVYQKDSHGWTALEHAIRWDAPQVAEELKGMGFAHNERQVLLEVLAQTNRQNDSEELWMESEMMEESDLQQRSGISGAPEGSKDSLSPSPASRTRPSL